MRVTVESLPGSDSKPNEDASAAGGGLVVVTDGATARTETGCVHGVAWFAQHLAAAMLDHGEDGPAAALKAAIVQTADRHRETCDLTNPATPAAAVAAVAVYADTVSFLVLGDVTLIVDGSEGLKVVVDDSVSRTAAAERQAADALPQGSPEKAAALVAMKRAELAARNVPGGFWTAATDPGAVDHAITWTMPRHAVSHVAILTDGAARIVEPFALMDWRTVLDTIAADGPRVILDRVREAERSDPDGKRWARNKTSDDATLAYLDFG